MSTCYHVILLQRPKKYSIISMKIDQGRNMYALKVILGSTTTFWGLFMHAAAILFLSLFFLLPSQLSLNFSRTFFVIVTPRESEKKTRINYVLKNRQQKSCLQPVPRLPSSPGNKVFIFLSFFFIPRSYFSYYVIPSTCLALVFSALPVKNIGKRKYGKLNL